MLLYSLALLNALFSSISADNKSLPLNRKPSLNVILGFSFSSTSQYMTAMVFLGGVSSQARRMVCRVNFEFLDNFF